MKNKLIKMAGGLTKSKIIVPIAVVCAFWVAQAVACDLLSSSMLYLLPKIVGVLSLAAFFIFFIIRMFRAGSRVPSLFGLCSLGVLAMTVSSAMGVNYGFQMQPVGMFVLLSLGLAFIGIMLDAERYWHLIRRGASNPIHFCHS
jgi:hypothetical protein